MSACEGRVREVIADQLGYDFDEVTLDAELVADLGADDLDLVELVMALEETFDTGGEIPDDKVQGWTTVQDVVACVDEVTSRPACPYCGSSLEGAAPAAGEETDG